MSIAYVNGELVDDHAARVPLDDRGLLYGDGLFETVRVKDGNPMCLAEHLGRLYRSAVAIKIFKEGEPREFVMPVSKLVTDLSGMNEYLQARIRVMLTRGTGLRGPRPVGNGKANLYVSVRELSDQELAKPHSGISAILASSPRNRHSPLIGHKTLNYQENVLALEEAVAAGADEAIFRNLDGRLCEGATTNLFIVKGGELTTPPVNEGLLPGITRQQVMKLAESLGISVHEHALEVDELWQADEVFLTNSILGVAGLREVDGKPIGGGEPGPITERLRASNAGGPREQLPC